MIQVTQTGSYERKKKSILISALRRFEKYGYVKTTMIEIANDVEMSAANLYRYFKSKREIGRACVEVCLAEHIHVLRELVLSSEFNAQERLKKFVLINLQYSYKISHDKEKIHGLVYQAVSDKNDFIRKDISMKVSLLKNILDAGCNDGEFNIDDTFETAKNIQIVTYLSDVPQFTNNYSLVELHIMMHGIINLILNGIKKN